MAIEATDSLEATAVAAAPVPSPVMVIEGRLVYPDPEAVVVIEAIEDETKATVPATPVPPPPEKARVGEDV